MAKWFALPGTTAHPDGPRAATPAFSDRLVDAFAATLAEEIRLVCTGAESPEELPAAERHTSLLRGGGGGGGGGGDMQPPPSQLRAATPRARRLEEMRPADIQAAAASGAVVLLPVGGLDAADSAAAATPCGAELLAVREACEVAGHQHPCEP